MNENGSGAPAAGGLCECTVMTGGHVVHKPTCWKATDRCSFCDGHGWLYEQPANVKAACPMCKGSGRFTPDKPAAGPPAVPALPAGARPDLFTESMRDPEVSKAFQEEWAKDETAMRVADAASPPVSAYERARRVMAEPAPTRDDVAQTIRAAESARDARWREALRLQENGELCPASISTLLYEAEHPEDPYRHECTDCAPLRDLLSGSAATAPKAPSSASGALAGTEEPTPKENQQQAAIRARSDREER